MASVTLLIPMTYYGGLPTASKPVWYGVGLVLLGVGSLVFISPELIATSTVDIKLSNIPPICNESYHPDVNEVSFKCNKIINELMFLLDALL